VDPDKKHLISDDHQRVNRVLSLPFGRRVLDVGCSDGTVSFEIARRYGSEVVGVDIATSAIAEAMKKLDQPPSLQSVVHFAVGFAEELDFTDESFDTVSACEVLEHIGASQLALALKNLVRMLKPGGNMIVTVPNRYPASRYIRGGRDRWRWPAHHQFFSRVSLARLLGEYFHQVTFYPLYDEDEDATDSVYLICECRGKRVR
jgi:ubiquinone/menaquinone biosynthesis C-methylase UbiE